MENPGCPSALDLVNDWLKEQFIGHRIVIIPRNHTSTYDDEIMIDDIGVAELKDTTLSLIDPTADICTIINLAHPESLQLLSECVRKYLISKAWGHIMCNNRHLNYMGYLGSPNSPLVVHRSSLGYRKIYKKELCK